MNETTKIYFDESGNTGDNLLDQNQPVYCLLSTSFSDQQADILLRHLKSNAKELHFKSLKKYRSSQLQILQILNHELISFETIKYSVSNKEYAVVGHIVDRLIEPVLYDMNHDGYASGINSFYANFLYLLGKYDWGQERLTKMTSSFQQMIRTKSDAAIEEFFKIIFMEYNRAQNERDIFDLIMRSLPQIKSILERMGKFDLDLSLSSFGILSDYWGRQLSRPFDVVHDDSKQIDFWKEYISFLSSPTIESKEVGFGDKTMRFPFLINSLQLTNSGKVPQIQLADILVSAIAYSASEVSAKKSKDQFATEIFRSKLMNINCHTLWPSTTHKFPVKEGEAGVSMLDYLANLAKENPEAYSKVIKGISK